MNWINLPIGTRLRFRENDKIYYIAKKWDNIHMWTDKMVTVTNETNNDDSFDCIGKTRINENWTIEK